MKKTVQKGNILIILVVITAVMVAGLIYYKTNSTKLAPPSEPSPKISTNSAEQTKIFQASSLKFTIELPVGYQAAEKLESVKITTKTGEILIGKNGTNFNNLDDYIKNSRNNITTRLTNRKELKINGLDAISGFIDGEKIYFIYVENTVYLISTNTSPLFNDLDQIAKSFRYTP